MTTPTLYDLARYYQNNGLVGEDRGAITVTIALAGDASAIARGYPGTGKTHLARIAVGLLPPAIVARVDMVSALGIWSKGMADRIAAARIVYFPEDQNASDNDEVVKVKKKWGDGEPAERAKSQDYGESTEIQTLPRRTFLSTAAITNDAHARTFDLESARRVVKVNTDPSESATGRVLVSMADALAKGRENVRVMSPLEARAVERHVARTMLEAHDAVSVVRFFGAAELVNAIPKTFPETRSAFALFEKVLLGVGRWYANAEVRVNGTVFLSPQRVAETWAFYGPILEENALKWETSDRELLSIFPAPKWNGEAIAPECALDIPRIMRELRPKGLTDQALVKRQLGRLCMKGFLESSDAFRTARWYKTSLADTANRVDWLRVVDACADGARKYLEGDALARYLALCEAAAGDDAMQNPLTGARGPIVGPKSVLMYDPVSGYAPVNVKEPAQPKGLLAFGKGVGDAADLRAA